MKTLSFRGTIIGLLVTFVTSYVICIAGDVFLGWTMYQVWMPLLPGFVWPITFSGFLLGLLWLVGYSIFLPIIFVLPYNYIVRRTVNTAEVV